MVSTAEAAERIGVSKNTLLRWIADGRLADVARDWRNWRCWSAADIERARALRAALHAAVAPAPVVTIEASKPMGQREYAEDLSRLGQGRRFRAPEGAGRKAAQVSPDYARELEALAEARRFRAAEPPAEQRRVS